MNLNKFFFLFSSFFLFLLGEIFAQDHLLIGTVHTEDGKPVHLAEVRIVGDGFGVTTETGEFRIELPNIIHIGNKVTLIVKYGDYVIKSPVNGTDVGSINIPGNPLSNPVKIIIVPRGSLSLLTDARIKELIKSVKYQLENKMKSISQHYAELSVDWGLPEEVLRDSVENRLSGKEENKDKSDPNKKYTPKEKPAQPVEEQQIVDKSIKYYRLGNEKFLQLDFESAGNCYKSAIKINPSHIDAIIMLGRVFQINREYQNALKCYHKALSLSIKSLGRSNLKVLECLGLVYKDMEKYKEAINYFHKALKIFSKDYSNDLQRKAKILENLGNSYLLFGEYSKAFKYLDEAKKIQSNLNGKDN